MTSPKQPPRNSRECVVFEVVPTRVNHSGTHHIQEPNVLEQDNTATLSNVAKAVEILNQLKQR